MTSNAKAEYDEWHEHLSKGEDSNPMQYPWYRSAYEGTVRQLRGRVLEIGCGRGDFAIWLAALVPDLRIIGADFSSTAARIATKRASAAKRPVQFLAGDALNLPFPDNAFDWVISCECMEHVAAPRVMASEIYRILRSGGHFCLTTENYFNGMIIQWAKCWVTGEPFNSGSGVQPLENFFVFFQVQRYLRDAGLIVDRTESSHYQWLLLPRVAPARLCTFEFKSRTARVLAKPFGRHFSYFGHQP
jgi:ubiquinone/menaquinone biosynthesis C-methylase UbiE